MPDVIALDVSVFDDADAPNGWRFCRAWTAAVDRWVIELFEAACDGASDGLALIAVGGYGRNELSPQSDLDLLLVHHKRNDIGEVAEKLWYPIWDSGRKLGHAVRTVDEALALAKEDLETATSMLSIRHLAGDRSLTDSLQEGAVQSWKGRQRRWLRALAQSVHDRHEANREVAFVLEPDLKEDRGGLRDVHALQWADLARPFLGPEDRVAMAAAYDELLAARVELHRRTGRPGDTLVLQEQDAVAEALGDPNADELMRRISGAARTVAWISDEAWRRIEAATGGPLGRLARRRRRLGPDFELIDGEVHIDSSANVAGDAVMILRAAATAAKEETLIARASLDRLAAESPAMPNPWPDEARSLFVELLASGRSAIPVWEALDHRDLLVHLIPEWEPNRSKPQRNAYHRFTIDRHLWEAAVEASALVGQVDRPDLLLVGALFHDIGKGYPGDHTDVGIELLETIAPRMGFDAEDTLVLQDMVRHHLLLPDVATRRDLDDDGTINAVAEAVGSVLTLRLLAGLTEADSIATGPAAWGGWKKDLVRRLVARAEHVLQGGDAEEITSDFPTQAHRDLMRAGRLFASGEGDRLTVVAPDRTGVLSRVAGALSMHGLGVMHTTVHSEEGMALQDLQVRVPQGTEVPWEAVTTSIEAALNGHLAIRARLAERARSYRKPRATAAKNVQPKVTVDNEMSEHSTVLEVHCTDRMGLLFDVTSTLADLDLDVLGARVQTLGHAIVDSFYVVDRHGNKITDGAHLAEIEKALVHSVQGSAG